MKEKIPPIENMNENPDKIVCYPNAWFGKALSNHDTTDLFPDTWINI